MVFENSRNKSSLLGLRCEPENLFCFANEKDIPIMHEKLRKSVTKW